jgi:DNA-binding beta-propeller fold protein YncE
MSGTRASGWAIAALCCTALIFRAVQPGGGLAQVVSAQNDSWATDTARRLGVRLIETRDASGPAAYPIAAGDLLFFTNVGTSYAAKNLKNSVVVINARTKKPIAISDLDPAWSERWVSHGIGVSPDGKYVYLPGIAPSSAKNPGSVFVLDARTLKIHQIISTDGQAPHHVKIYQDWTGKQRMLVEEFNWIGAGLGAHNATGTGFYVIDPADNNKVVAGMGNAEARGTLYAGFTAPDGRYLYYSLPGPDFRTAIIGRGYLSKIDMQTWKVVQSIPMGAYPLWTVFTRNGQWAWITNSGDNKVVKIQRATAPGQVDRVVAEVRTGEGPYGLRLSIDDKDLWVADKGEGIAGQRGMSITVVDAEANQVKRTIQAQCVTNDHIILSPDGQEMWATCNQSHEIVVLDARTYEVKNRIPMPNQGDSHGGSFVFYSGAGGSVGETVSDQNGLHGSARDAAMKGVPWQR